MKFRFQSFVDIQTSAQSMQIFQWSVGGAEVINRCRHLFGAYKYFKLGKISVKMDPASTLPVDPQGLSYAEDDPQTVDPRDQQNRGLVRITNGEDVFTNVSALTDDQQMGVYYSMLLDPRWSKFYLQSGFRRSAYPLYWQVGQLQQDKYPGATTNIPWFTAQGIVNSPGVTVIQRESYTNGSTGANNSTEGGSSARGFFQTGHRGRLGFLPTDYYQEIVNATGGKVTTAGLNNVPEVKVITCVLPKAYKTIYYYRVYITEEVIFAGLRSAPYNFGGNSYVNPIDQFLTGSPVTMLPTGAAVLPVTENFNNNNGEKLP